MLSTLIGHDLLKPQLISIMGSPGTYLFHGPKNAGKRTAAFEISKKILCIEKKEDGCQCPSCKRFGSEHPDFMCIGRHEKTKIEHIDDLLYFTQLSSFLSDRKIAIIDNADNITWEAANRLLKILEEPKENFFFFLITSDTSKIISTIISRSVTCKFGSLSQEDIINILWKKTGVELQKARILGWISVESSEDIFSNPALYLTSRDLAFEFISNIKHRDLTDALDFIDKIEYENIIIFSDMLLLILTDMLLSKSNLDIINVDLKKDLDDMSKEFDIKALLGATNIVSQIKRNRNLNINISMIIKNAIMKFLPLLQVETCATKKE